LKEEARLNSLIAENLERVHSEIQQHEKLQPLVGEIRQTKSILILTKCKDPLEMTNLCFKFMALKLIV